MLDTRDLYRLPWSKGDTPVSWLGVTDVCDLGCEGCERQGSSGHRSAREIGEEIRFLKRLRHLDTILISGGEPLLHPQILDIVALIAHDGIKPVVFTNAVDLTPTLVRQLKRVGLYGLTVHIDSGQNRPGWEGNSEDTLNNLRQHCADMVAGQGNLVTFFSTTVRPATLDQVPNIVRWGQANVDRVQGLAFVTHQATGAKHPGQRSITNRDVYEMIANGCPGYAPCAYLGDTVRSNSYRWLKAATIGSEQRIYGSVGRETMELAQVVYHLVRGIYLTHVSRLKFTPLVFLASLWDQRVRQAARNWWADVRRQPIRLFERIYAQMIDIVHVPAVQWTGRENICSGYPAESIWNGMLIHSCRMDGYRLFGQLLRKNRVEIATGSGDEDLCDPHPISQ